MIDDLEPGQHRVRLNGVELYFEDVGPDDAQTIVFLHGLGYNSYSFRDLTGELLEKFRVVYLDQRGCGRSEVLEPAPELFTVDTLVEDLEALRKHLNLRRFTPLGHGFGAVIALEYARRFPNNVNRVITVNPWIHFPELSRVLLDSASRLTERDPEFMPEDSEARAEMAFSMREDLLSVLHFPSPSARLHLEFVDSESGLFGGGAAQEMLVFNRLWELEYPLYFPEIRSPVYVIAGVLDSTSYPSQTDWLLDLLSAELLEVETGHYPWLEDAEVFVRALEHAMDG
jgi:proline iminopeptidase